MNFDTFDKKYWVSLDKPNIFLEAVLQTRSVKKVFREISQNLQENTCARVSFLIKLLDNFY